MFSHSKACEQSTQEEMEYVFQSTLHSAQVQLTNFKECYQIFLFITHHEARLHRLAPGTHSPSPVGSTYIP